MRAPRIGLEAPARASASARTRTQPPAAAATRPPGRFAQRIG